MDTSKTIESPRVCIALIGVVDWRTIKTARALAAAGSRVKIITVCDSDPENFDGEPFEVEYHKPPGGGSRVGFRPLRIALNLTVRKYARWRMRGLLSNYFEKLLHDLIVKEPFDLVWAVNAYTLKACTDAATHLNARLIYEAYEYWPEHALESVCSMTPSERTFVLDSERRYIHQADAVITVSPYLASCYKDLYHLGDTPFVIYNAPLNAVGQPTKASFPLKVLHLGNFQVERNFYALLEAAVMVDNVVLTFQGGGRESDALKARIKSLGVGDRVFVRPPVPFDEVPFSASCHDIGVVCYQPHNRQYEGALPNKLFEYMAGGLAVVASDTEAFRTFPNFERFGRLLDSVDAEGIAAALTSLTNDIGLVNSMKEESLRAASIYAGDAQAQAVASIFAAVMNAER